MKVFAFTLRNAFARIAHQRLLSIIVVLTVALGMLFPLADFAMANDMLEMTKNSVYQDEQHTAVVDFSAPCTDEPSVTTNLRSLSPDIRRFGFSAIYQTTLTCKDLRIADTVGGFNKNYLDVGRYYQLVDGRLPSEEEYESGAKVCLIRQKTRLDNAGVKIGDTVSISATDFRVIGKINTVTYGSVLIPYRSLIPLAGNVKLQFNALLQTKDIPNTVAIGATLKRLPDASAVLVKSGSEVQKQFIDSSEPILKKDLLTGLAVLLFAAVSFVLIVVGKMLDDQYVTGVKMAVGATKRQIFADLFTQNAVLITAAIVIDFLVVPLAPMVLTKFSLLLDWKVVLLTICVGFIFALIVTLIVAMMFLSQNVSELLRKRL